LNKSTGGSRPARPRHADTFGRVIDSPIDSVIEEFVAARRGEADEHDDLISMLLSATDEDGESMSAELVRDELMTFLFAGHETTATALTFTWLLLSQHPEVERTLVAELEEVLDGEPPSFADLPDLEYTEQVLREAMRLYPPVPQIPRDTTEPVELGGYGIPEGATVAACQWTVHRDGSLWSYPHEFRPERFEHDDRPRFAYFPFGGGPRRCIGEQFAMVEGKLILATLARRYHLELVSDPDVDLSVSITTRPLDPIEARVEHRTGSQ
jgi:cytochrome P450